MNGGPVSRSEGVHVRTCVRVCVPVCVCMSVCLCVCLLVRRVHFTHPSYRSFLLVLAAYGQETLF